jgi:hypothetical protein
MITELATKQTVVMNVAYLGSGMRVPGCQDNVDDAMPQIVAMNAAYLSTGLRVTGCHVNDDSIGNEADSGNECCLP